MKKYAWVLLLIPLLIAPDFPGEPDHLGVICATMTQLSAANDNYVFWTAPPFSVRVDKAWCIYDASTPTDPADIDLQDAAGNAMTMTDVTCSAKTSPATSVQSVTGGNTLVAYEAIALNVTNTPNPNAQDKYTICFAYTRDG